MLCHGCVALLLAATPPLAATSMPSLGPADAAPAPDHESRAIHGELAAAPLFALGLLPSLGSGVALSSELRWSYFSLAAEARLLASLDAQTERGVPIRTGVTMPVLRLCGHRGLVSLCGVLGAGELRPTGDGATDVEIRDPWVTSAGLRLGLEWVFVDRLALRGFAELHAAFSRPSVRVDRQQVWMAAPAFGLVGVGLVWRLDSR